MGGSDHCPSCFCEEYERDCGRRPAGTPNVVPSVAGRPQKRVVGIGRILHGPKFCEVAYHGVIVRGPLGFQR